MGRPVNKRYFGDPADGTNLTVRAYVANADGAGNAGVDEQAYILAQKGTNKFKIANNATTPTSETAICRLVNKATAAIAEGEMVLEAMNAGGERVVLKKLFNRTATDWASNRYTWVLEDDSTDTVIRLTAI